MSTGKTGRRRVSDLVSNALLRGAEIMDTAINKAEEFYKKHEKDLDPYLEAFQYSTEKRRLEIELEKLPKEGRDTDERISRTSLEGAIAAIESNMPKAPNFVYDAGTSYANLLYSKKK